MPDDLIHEDVLVWSERQAALLRRLAAGERVNDAIDWENVIEEIEDVGPSELHSVENLLARAMEHLLKVEAFPHGSIEHWRGEASTVLAEARRRFAPSMRQRIDLTELYEVAFKLVLSRRVDGREPLRIPGRCPFPIDELILRDRRAIPDVDALFARLAGVRREDA